jgi:tetratricopeptide (TPR) repeat protein
MNKRIFDFSLLFAGILTSATYVMASADSDKTESQKVITLPAATETQTPATKVEIIEEHASENTTKETKANANLSSATSQDTGAVPKTGLPEATATQSQNQKDSASEPKTSENASAVSNTPSPLQEKVKKELEEIDKTNVKLACKADEMAERFITADEQLMLCNKLKNQPFPSVTGVYLMLGSTYYHRALRTGKYQDAINYHEWLLRAGKVYKDKFLGSRVYINHENIYLADLNSLKGDYDKAEEYCKQYFSTLPEANRERKELEKNKDVMLLRAAIKPILAKDIAKLKSLTEQRTGLANFSASGWLGMIDIAMARINYGRGNYDKAAEFLAKAKALSVEKTPAKPTSSKKPVRKAARSAGTKKQ